jgi:hypothetical protein
LIRDESAIEPGRDTIAIILLLDADPLHSGQPSGWYYYYCFLGKVFNVDLVGVEDKIQHMYRNIYREF